MTWRKNKPHWHRPKHKISRWIKTDWFTSMHLHGFLSWLLETLVWFFDRKIQACLHLWQWSPVKLLPTGDVFLAAHDFILSVWHVRAPERHQGCRAESWRHCHFLLGLCCLLVCLSVIFPPHNRRSGCFNYCFTIYTCSSQSGSLFDQ